MKNLFFSRVLAVSFITFLSHASNNGPSMDVRDSELVGKQAAEWAQAFVDVADYNDVVSCANCLYLSLHVIKLDEKMRRSMNALIRFTAQLHMATARYDNTDEIMSSLRTEIEQFSTLKSGNDAVIEKWQDAVAACEGNVGTPLQAALAHVTDRAAAATVAWSQHESRPLGSLSGEMNNNIAAVFEKMQTVVARYEQIMGADTPATDSKAESFEEIPLASLFSNNCQELTTCGLGLLLTAQQGFDGAAYGLQAGPATIFIQYYQALYKAYQKRYGADATIPFL